MEVDQNGFRAGIHRVQHYSGIKPSTLLSAIICSLNISMVALLLRQMKVMDNAAAAKLFNPQTIQ
jgi:hypothetical protein